MLESRPTCFGVGGHDIGLLYDGVHHFTVVDWGSAGPLWPMYDLALAIGLIGAMGPEVTTGRPRQRQPRSHLRSAVPGPHLLGGDRARRQGQHRLFTSALKICTNVRSRVPSV